MLLAFDRLPGAMARYHALMPVEVPDEPRKTCERRLATHNFQTALGDVLNRCLRQVSILRDIRGF